MDTKILFTFEGFKYGPYILQKQISGEGRYYEQCGTDDNDPNYFDNTDKEDFLDEFFNGELMWGIKKINYVQAELLEDLRNSNTKLKNLYLAMLTNTDNSYLEAVENLLLNDLIIDKGLAFENEFYTIHHIELMNINTGETKKAYGYIGTDDTCEASLCVIEIINNDDYLNNKYVSQKVSNIEEVLEEIKNHIKKSPDDGEAKEDLLQIKKEKEYLTKQFLIDINTAKNSFTQ